jgi:amidase
MTEGVISARVPAMIRPNRVIQNRNESEYLTSGLSIPALHRPTRFARGATIRHRDWLAVDEWRAGYRARWARFFRDFDVLLCPVMPTDALQHDHSEPAADRTVLVDGRPFPYWDQVAWAGAITAAYLPAVAAPIGRTRHGMPVGVQIVAPYLRDRTAIDFARQLADVVGGFEPPPGF